MGIQPNFLKKKNKDKCSRRGKNLEPNQLAKKPHKLRYPVSTSFTNCAFFYTCKLLT